MTPTEVSPDDYALLLHLRMAERDAIVARQAVERYLAQKYALRPGDSIGPDRQIVHTLNGTLHD